MLAVHAVRRVLHVGPQLAGIVARHASDSSVSAAQVTPLSVVMLAPVGSSGNVSSPTLVVSSPIWPALETDADAIVPLLSVPVAGCRHRTPRSAMRLSSHIQPRAVVKPQPEMLGCAPRTRPGRPSGRTRRRGSPRAPRARSVPAPRRRPRRSRRRTRPTMDEPRSCPPIALGDSGVDRPALIEVERQHDSSIETAGLRTGPAPTPTM